MKKTAICGILAFSILFILYVLTVFLVPFSHTTIFWISFAFTVVAFLLVGASLYVTFFENVKPKDKIYSFSIAKIGLIYGIIQLITGLVFMALSEKLQVWLAVLVYAFILGVTIVALLSTKITITHIQVQDEKVEKDISLIRRLQAKLKKLTEECENPEVIAPIKKLSDELYYSDPVSSIALTEIEQKLDMLVDELQSEVTNNDKAAIELLCEKTMTVLHERNRLCRQNKGKC